MGNAIGSDADVTYSFVPEEPGRVLATLAQTLGPMPRVLLPDTGGSKDEPPVVRPSSEEMPPQSCRSPRVQLLGEIARGGMGAVLKGRDPDLGRDLAVKVLLEAHRDKPDFVRRFVEEAQIGGQLQHPGIVPVYDLGTFADRRPFFAMKLVKGRTLAALLAERTLLPPGDSHVGNGGTVISGPMYGRSLRRSASGSRGCHEYSHAGPGGHLCLVRDHVSPF
jgi:hypothetical protein